MPYLPRGIKFARIEIDRNDRIRFLERDEISTDEGWWESALSDPRARSSQSRVNDTMLGFYRAMFIEIFCGNCNQHFAKAVDDMVVMYGDRCSVSHAVNAQVNCRRSAKRCGVDFKIRQWEDVAKLRRR
jgi:hypothetical protein